MNELIKTLVSILCFLTMTFNVIPAYRVAWEPRKTTETITYKQNFWKRIPGAPQDYVEPMVYSDDCPEGRRLEPVDIDGQSTPAAWQVGWRWNGYIVVQKTTTCTFDVVLTPSKESNWIGLPKTYYKKYIQKNNCVWVEVDG